jgi:hypothetical protein
MKGGSGVFVARAILDIEYDDALTGALLRQASSDSTPDISDILLYPNPTSGKLTYSANLFHYHDFKLEISDVYGRVLMAEFLNSGEPISVKDYSVLGSGIYWIQVFCDDQLIEIRKLVVQI